MTGVIYFYNDPKGFGFIRMPDDSEIFFHITNVENKRAEIGMRVEFDIGPAMNKKSQAIHVRPVESPAGVAALSGGAV